MSKREGVKLYSKVTTSAQEFYFLCFCYRPLLALLSLTFVALESKSNRTRGERLWPPSRAHVLRVKDSSISIVYHQNITAKYGLDAIIRRTCVCVRFGVCTKNPAEMVAQERLSFSIAGFEKRKTLFPWR